MTDVLGSGIGYWGETPFATCFMQVVAGVARERGVPDAVSRLGPSWGFRQPTADRLHGGDRWLEAMASITGLSLSQFGGLSAAETFRREDEALERGAALVVAVDSYDIPSPYTGTEHLIHALLVIGKNDRHVVVSDMMNHPEPRPMNLADYQRSRMSAEARGLTMVCEKGAATSLGEQAIVTSFAGELRRHRAELAVLDGFAESVANGDGRIDVSEAAAERLALSQLFSGLSGEHRWASSGAAEMLDLARRWYLLHIMAREAARNDTPLRPSRLSRMLRDLHEREAELNGRLADQLTCSTDIEPRSVVTEEPHREPSDG